MIIVIPCFNENNLLLSLNSIVACQMPEDLVEVIVIINEPAGIAQEISAANSHMFSLASDWAKVHSGNKIKFEIYREILNPKDAGVGLARKIGMDVAAERLCSNGKKNDIIVCFDADSCCDPNYLVALEQHFRRYPKTPGASLYFEHPLEGPMDPLIYEAIIKYELHLRYYVNALRFAGHPFAFHTIGSSMAVRAEVYLAQGGMNKRKAGEDFYFLQKIIPLGNFTEISTTRVIPSPRISDRVPFGTGKAVGDYQQKKQLLTYNLQSFKDLKILINNIENLYYQNITEVTARLPDSIMAFLTFDHFNEKITEIKSNTHSYLNFRNRFFRWFNGFITLKYIHFARDHFYPSEPVGETGKLFIHQMYDTDFSGSEKEMLLLLRHIDKMSNWGSILPVSK